MMRTKEDYDGRGQKSCKCNYVHFYIEARPPCSRLAQAADGQLAS